ncbi:MAG: hypothetical protein OXI83_03320, partial [Gemmatimonadota bacterium]|nr:hypothetical protein [Gemmatimonadota bacterium]
MVRFLTFPFSRHPSRRRIAGLEFLFGTMSIYMATVLNESLAHVKHTITSYMGTYFDRFRAVLPMNSSPWHDSSAEIIWNFGLELVRFAHPLFSGPSRWRISDNNTLFQLSVFRDLYMPGRRFPRGVGEEITWLENLEGPMLERLADEWLRERAGQEWVESGIHFKSPAGTGKIDVAALMQQEGGVKLVLGGCKRAAAQHRPGQLVAVFDGFMASLADSGLQGRMKRADKEFRLLISPEVTPGERQRLRDGRFEPLDIR